MYDISINNAGSIDTYLGTGYASADWVDTTDGNNNGTPNNLLRINNATIAVDATQTTAGNQPRIVSNGVLVTENNIPAISFDGVDDRLYVTGYLAQLSQQL